MFRIYLGFTTSNQSTSIPKSAQKRFRMYNQLRIDSQYAIQSMISNSTRSDSLREENLQESDYSVLCAEFNRVGITFRSNQLLHRMSAIKGYPYPLLLEICKMFHFNQFETIFFCHILDEEESLLQSDPTIFDQDLTLTNIDRIYNRITDNDTRRLKKSLRLDEEKEGLELEQEIQYWNLSELKVLYIYLIVIGYSVKSYLNEGIKPYEEHVREIAPHFFEKVFNVWVDKESNHVLRTSPKKINQFYTAIFQSEESAPEINEVDCQYRNYNEIIDELIKATTEFDNGGAENSIE